MQLKLVHFTAKNVIQLCENLTAFTRLQ